MHGRHPRFAVLVFLCLAGACAPLLAAGDQIHVIDESEMQHWWHVPAGSQNPAPPYPIDAIRRGVEGCMVVAFEINRDGSVSNERVWLDKIPQFSGRKAMERAALLAVHQWRFAPVAENTNREAVYTYHTFTYTLSGSSKWTTYDQQHEDKLKATCKVPDFPQQVQAMINANTQAANAKP